ncbi:hypothetical protein ASD37_26610 [Mycobacterium sp. Root135]|uniref:YybH family protein n=1 Tax=Mycobacterium sp. Root135 TaxID=1736457 RepID=UPI0006F406BB|nr:SgcJ/EcaC family oxidoreductase [Mycobacterium sp. Root135]KQY03090.1 hypothetical protein ASD37_26610 [Mycobacterium sp. Root135]
MTTAEAVVVEVLDRWKAAIEARRPDEVAALFADDAIFQGLRPYAVGRQGITEYYAGQPVGLSPDYRVLETRQPAPGVVFGYVAVDFTFTDRAPVPTLLGVLLTNVDDRWLIAHYQVSPAPAG